ncbi:MAG: glycosyl hydrolase [Tepidisphaeraceae bacterium]
MTNPFAAAATTRPLSNRIFRGINIDPVYELKTPDDLITLSDALRASKVGALRVPLRWIVVEPQKGNWDWSRMDRALKAIPAEIEIVAMLMSVPPWASGVDPAKVEGFPDVYPPRDLRDWDQFVGRAVQRYQGRIRHWEIWNEENGIDFFRPAPDAPRYVEILKSAYRAAKAVDSRCKIVLGGLQMNGVIPNPWSAVKTPDFLEYIYRAGGGKFFDICNTHPYVLPTEGAAHMINLTRDTRAVMAKHGDEKKPLWLTEMGCGLNNGTTPEAQAQLLSDSYALAAKEPGIDRLYWFTLRDFERDALGPEASMGLVTYDWKPKPAFEAFRKLPR